MTGTARRRVLAALAAGAALGGDVVKRALANGDAGPAQGIRRLEGTVRVDGREARLGTPVAPGQRVATGARSQALVVIGHDAFLLRADTAIDTEGGEGVLRALAVRTGRILSVFSRKAVEIRVPHATIGIRGTGAYVELRPESIYFCLCYGEAVVRAPGMAEQVVKTHHHDHPMVISEAGGVMHADPAGVVNHTDAELVLLESLVGREPPFKDAPGAGRY